MSGFFVKVSLAISFFYDLALFEIIINMIFTKRIYILLSEKIEKISTTDYFSQNQLEFIKTQAK